ncbi:CLUMA_CG002696, isoform A [Clunio marinus]|uniref:CLUMA_CG002696, isoform A n=1 Tax=Clunio marinus TaxID=568069 RepID=A0A1J1HM02_9DIPT|nr:CLUMA_CG002696, isoform A [Clunio marinus]
MMRHHFERSILWRPYRKSLEVTQSKPWMLEIWIVIHKIEFLQKQNITTQCLFKCINGFLVVSTLICFLSLIPSLSKPYATIYAGSKGDSLNIRNIVLKSAFSTFSNLNFIHLNPGSMKKNLDDFRILIKNVNVHIIAVSETWFKPHHNSNALNIPGFSLYRHDRNNLSRCRGGGIAFYVKDNIKAKVVSKSRHNGLTEFMFLELSGMNNQKLIFGVVYNPPNTSNFQPLLNSINNLMSTRSDILIVGDFNSNMLNQSPSTKRLLHEFSMFGLECHQSEPTNFSNIANPSLIDLIFCNQNLLNRFTQMSPGSYTTHDLLIGSYNFSLETCNNDIVKTYLDYKNVDENLLLQAISLQNWDELYKLSAIDDQIKLINNFINELMSQVVPFDKLNQLPKLLSSFKQS